MPVVQCPNCDKKLNLREPKPGKKLRCPGCEEPFTPFPAKDGKRPAKKRRPAPVDDFGDEDDEFDEPTPRRRKKTAAKKGGGKNKKSAAGGKKSKLPLFLGLGVLGVALAGGVAFMLMSANSDTGGSTDAGGETNAAAAPAEATATAQNDGAPADGHDGTSASPSGHGAPVAASISSTGADPVAAMTSGGATAEVPGNISLQWLPQQAEGLVHIDVDRLLSGPVGQLLQSPFVTGPIGQFRDKAGFGPEDIQSITIGASGFSTTVSAGQPPSLDSIPFVGVVRAKRALDAAKIQTAIPGAQSVTQGSATYIRLPGNPPTAMWFADSSTAVFGAEPSVVRAVQSGSTPPPTTLDTALLDGKSVLQLVFSPADAAIFQHPNLQVPPQSPAGTKATVAAIREHVTAVSLGIDFTNDIAFSMNTRCRDAAGAQAVAAALKQANEDNKTQVDAMANSPQAAMLGPMIEIQRKMIETSQITAADTICRSSSSAAGGGQQLVTQLPILIGQAMAQGLSQRRSMGQGIQPQDNFKTIALAMQNFHSAYKRFPNPAPQSPTGVKWLSWRVHLLPFLGQQSLYEQFKLQEPWDSPTNRPLADQMPDVFRSPSSAGVPQGRTLYQVPIGPGTAFEGGKGMGMSEFTDGTSNTILIVEASPARAVYWTQPDDFAFNPANPMDGLEGIASGGFRAAFADGSIKTVTSAAGKDVVKGMFTRNGGETIPPNALADSSPDSMNIGNDTGRAGAALPTGDISLETRKVLNGQVELLIPAGFTPMPENLLNVKFPLQKPAVAFSDKSYSTIIALTEAQKVVRRDNFASFKFDLEKVFQNVAVGGFTRNESFAIRGADRLMRTKILLEFTSNVANVPTHNTVVSVPMNGKALIVTFMTPASQAATWLPFEKKISDSINVQE